MIAGFLFVCFLSRFCQSDCRKTVALKLSGEAVLMSGIVNNIVAVKPARHVLVKNV